ncbi:50S ribosomal protein L22 [bacterium]|nr:50S ribosomal protein L22 [bacterium]
MPVQAIAKGVSMSPRKVAVVAALVRGRTVEDALTILSHVPRRSAVPVRKVIESAKANADHNHGLKPATLKIIEISVSPGPRLKRYRPAARGQALPFQRKKNQPLKKKERRRRLWDKKLIQ